MQELLEQQEPKLFLGIARINECKYDAMEGEVPGREPGILPFVGDRHDPHRIEMLPVLVTDAATRRRRRPFRAVAFQPDVDVEKIALLRPEQPRGPAAESAAR